MKLILSLSFFALLGGSQYLNLQEAGLYEDMLLDELVPVNADTAVLVVEFINHPFGPSPAGTPITAVPFAARIGDFLWERRTLNGYPSGLLVGQPGTKIRPGQVTPEHFAIPGDKASLEAVIKYMESRPPKPSWWSPPKSEDSFPYADFDFPF